MSTRKRVRSEEGWVLITSIVVLGLMLIVGLTLLSVTDIQSQASGKQRQGDSAFNYAEGALHSTAFLLARSWPDAATLTPDGTTAACGSASQSLTGTIGAADPATLAGRIQNQLTQSFASSGSSDYPATRTSWKVNICDDTPGTTAWNDTTMTSTAAWDSNGALTVNATDPATGQPYTYKVRRVWVRAQATVSGRTRAVVGLVQVNVKPALPSHYAALVGGFTADLTTTTNALLTGPTLAPVTERLLGQHQLYQADPLVSGSGKLGIRCGLLSGNCVTGGVLAAVSQTTASALLLRNDFVQYGSPTAVSDDVLDGFRREAKLRGYYHSTTSAGSPCIAGSEASDPQLSTKIVFLETVGNGDEACKITSSVSPKMLVVANGRVLIDGTSTSAGQPVFTGVLYAPFKQANRSPAPNVNGVVTISKWAKVQGAIYIDGSGKLDVQPPPLNLNTLCTALLGSFVCGTLPVGNLLNAIIGLTGLTPVVNGLVGQLSGYGPVVQEQDSLVNAITTYGNSGTIAGTFRQITRN